MKETCELEEWRDIPNTKGFYQISSLGRARSVDRKIDRVDGFSVFWKGRVLRPNTAPNGYLYFSNGNTLYIHRCVAEAFIPREDSTLVVDHINNNKLDNRASNLQWLSTEDNVRKSILGHYFRKPAFLHDNSRAKKVFVYNAYGRLVRHFLCAKQISYDYKINYSTLRRKLQCDTLYIGDLHYSYL